MFEICALPILQQGKLSGELHFALIFSDLFPRTSIYDYFFPSLLRLLANVSPIL